MNDQERYDLMVDEIYDLKHQNAALRAELAEYSALASEYGIDGKTMLELAKSQIKTAKANCELMEELEQYKNTEMDGESVCNENEMQEPCEYCRNVPSRYCAIRAHGFYQVAADDVDDPELEVNYCPVCGRRLELEEESK